MEDSEGDRSLANPADTDEGSGSEMLRKIKDPFDPLITSKEDPRWWWWGFSGYAKFRYQIVDPSVVESADLVRA